MRRVEFSYGSVHVFSVEPHLLGDASIAVKPDYLQHLVVRRARARISGMRLNSDQRMPIAPYRDGILAVIHHARIEVSVHFARPLSRWQGHRCEADDPTTTLD